MAIFFAYNTDANTSVYLWEADGGSVWYKPSGNTGYIDRSTANMRFAIAPTNTNDFQIINNTITIPFPSTHNTSTTSMTVTSIRTGVRSGFSSTSVVSPVDGTSKNVAVVDEITLTRELITLDNGTAVYAYTSSLMPKNGDGVKLINVESHSLSFDFTDGVGSSSKTFPNKAYYGQILRNVTATINTDDKVFIDQNISTSIPGGSGTPFYSFGLISNNGAVISFEKYQTRSSNTGTIETVLLTVQDAISTPKYIKYGLLNIPNNSNIAIYENIGSNWTKITDTFKTYDDSLSILQIGIWLNNPAVYYIESNVLKLPYGLESSEIESTDASQSLFNSIFNTNTVNFNTGDLLHSEIEFTRSLVNTSAGDQLYLYIATLPLNETGHKALKFSVGTMLAIEQNCAPSMDNMNIFAGQKFAINATALDGYEFINPDSCTVDFPSNQYTYYSTISSDGNTSEYFYIVQNTEITSTLYVYFTAEIKQTPITETYPFIQVYSPETTELNKLAEKRFNYLKNGSTEYADLADYILDVYRIFIDVPLSEIKTNIRLYTYDTDIESYVVTEQKIVTTCGSVYVQESPYNKIAYETVELFIYLPFYGIEKLDVNKYTGKFVYLDYITDILTGDCTIMLYYMINDDKIIIDLFNANIAYKIPYESNVNKPIKTITTNSLMLLNTTPYFIKRIPYSSIENVVQNNNKRDVINNFSGYNQFKDIEINCDCPTNEYDEIIKCLEEGVIL